ncbi:MAG: hypothetical protein ACI9NY_001208 [Kiritimatiellia bacterium]|jgi:hypothetical protein
MNKRRRLSVFYWLSALVIGGVVGNTVAEIPQELNTPTFKFTLNTQAKVLYQSNEDVSDYIIALDKYKKAGNRWTPEKFLRKQGQVIRYTLEMPRDYIAEEIFDFYRDQIPMQAERLFSCNSRACGESNNWANDHFGIKFLYGENTSQHYAVFRLAGSQQLGQSVNYMTIYTVRRGNRRLYAQLEVFLERR